MPFEIFAKEAGRWKVQLVSYLNNLRMAVAQFDFGRGDHRLVDPLFGRCSARLSHDSAQIALCYT